MDGARLELGVCVCVLWWGGDGCLLAGQPFQSSRLASPIQQAWAWHGSDHCTAEAHGGVNWLHRPGWAPSYLVAASLVPPARPAAAAHPTWVADGRTLHLDVAVAKVGRLRRRRQAGCKKRGAQAGRGVVGHWHRGGGVHLGEGAGCRGGAAQGWGRHVGALVLMSGGPRYVFVFVAAACFHACWPTCAFVAACLHACWPTPRGRVQACSPTRKRSMHTRTRTRKHANTTHNTRAHTSARFACHSEDAKHAAMV